MAFLTRAVAALFALASLLGLHETASAQTALPGARVVWVRGDRIYVASTDSVALDARTILIFVDRGKKVATGEVAAVHEGVLISARLTTGSFKKVKHLDRLKVTTLPPVVRGPSLLRVGYPAARRKNLLFDCSYQSLDSSLRVWDSGTPALHEIYRSEVLDDHARRLVRVSMSQVAAPMPETLFVRLFDEIADEEIALERGDLDVAVFWPGEASSHIREVMGWSQRWSGGIGGRGIITVTAWRPDQTNETVALRDDECRALERLNHELFRDDLYASRGWANPLDSANPGRFEVDPSLPGRETIERFLNQAMRSGATIDTARVIRLQYGEFSPQTRRSGAEYLLLVRCPAISAQKLQPYLNAINVEAIANLFQCLPAPKKP